MYFAIAWKLRFWSRKSSKFGSARRDGLPFEVTSKTAMIRFESGYGSGRSNTPYTTLKMAVVAPMPSASVTTMIAGTPGFLTSPRAANRKSCQKPRMFLPGDTGAAAKGSRMDAARRGVGS